MNFIQNRTPGSGGARCDSAGTDDSTVAGLRRFLPFYRRSAIVLCSGYVHEYS